MSEAWSQVGAWLDQPPAWIPSPGDRHRHILTELLAGVTAPRHVPDAHLAALAMEYGLVLHSSDRDFARFPGLRWSDPLRA